MNDVKKLSVLEFKKEQLVNLNEEEMFKVKGGSTIGCLSAGTAFAALAYQYGKGESFWHCANNVPQDNFEVTKIQFEDVTCASIDWVYIYGY